MELAANDVGDRLSEKLAHPQTRAESPSIGTPAIRAIGERMADVEVLIARSLVSCGQTWIGGPLASRC